MSAGIDLHCRDEERRRLARDRGINGIDYVDVSRDQRSLRVFFLLKAPPEVTIANVRIEGGRRIRDIAVTDVRMCRVEDPDLDDCMVVDVDRYGDFSCYRLCLVEPGEDGLPGTSPMNGIDPRHACVDFTFKVECPSTADCLPVDDCPPEVYEEPELSYLAKDYASFRQLILDRLALVMPEWRERLVPDLGIALVELLAYVGDYLSYHQDAVATEAYLETARLRTSVRRHARLVDYRMHDGCNARAWVCVETDSNVQLPADVSFITGPLEPDPTQRVLTWTELASRPFNPYEVFQPVVRAPVDIWRAHNAIRLHTWGDGECCLPRGATSATLLDTAAGDLPADAEEPTAYDDDAQQSAKPGEGDYGPAKPGKGDYEPDQPAPPSRSLHLGAGDVVIFEEVIGAKTGEPADANPRHRHAVMLTRVEEDIDAVTGDLVLEVEWDRHDALPFAVCVSAVGEPPECRALQDVTIVRGNVVLCDHGRPVRDEIVGTVPVISTLLPCEDAACGEVATHVAGRFEPHLREQPVTFAVALPAQRCAQDIMLPPDPRTARPQVELANIPLAPGGAVTLFGGEDVVAPESLVTRMRDEADVIAQAVREQLSAETLELLEHEDPDDPLSSALRAALVGDLRRLMAAWAARPDLLGSDADDRHYVVEVDDDSVAQLRFGDGDAGSRPPANAVFVAGYRVGNGPLGNVGADTITRIVFDATVIRNVDLRPRNPLAAVGGTAAELVADVKRRAPGAFRRDLVRAITAADYARVAERHPGVQRAAATMRWHGSWPVVRVAVDALADRTTPELLAEVRRLLEPARRIGHEVVIAPATQVPLLVGMHVCVEPFALRAHVELDLRHTLGSKVLAGGGLGFFHPDALTFGDDIRLSALVARAQAVPGVESVTVTALQRLHGFAESELEDGVLRLGALEVAQLSGDLDFPENGRLELVLEGGR